MVEAHDFETATDERGNLLHPRFAEVFDEIVELLASGATQDLSRAYVLACAKCPPGSESIN